MKLGHWVGEHVKDRVSQIQVLDISSSLPNAAARRRGFAQGLHESWLYGYDSLALVGQAVHRQGGKKGESHNTVEHGEFRSEPYPTSPQRGGNR